MEKTSRSTLLSPEMWQYYRKRRRQLCNFVRTMVEPRSPEHRTLARITNAKPGQTPARMPATYHELPRSSKSPWYRSRRRPDRPETGRSVKLQDPIQTVPKPLKPTSRTLMPMVPRRCLTLYTPREPNTMPQLIHAEDDRLRSKVYCS